MMTSIELIQSIYFFLIKYSKRFKLHKCSDDILINFDKLYIIDGCFSVINGNNNATCVQQPKKKFFLIKKFNFFLKLKTGEKS